jgi:zinc transporter, ZIP family
VLEAFAWAFVAALSLVAGGAVALVWRVGPRALGLTMAFGAGVLISAVAYELIAEAIATSENHVAVAIGLAAGAITFYLGDRAIDGMGGTKRKSVAAEDGSGSAPAIVLGIVLDGIPESIVIGLTLLGGGAIELALVAAVFLSNVPESIAATAGLRGRGWSGARVTGLWLGVALLSGLAALIGYSILGSAPSGAVALVNAFAAGAILTMLADTMIPEAYEHARLEAGLATTLGFGVSVALSALT